MAQFLAVLIFVAMFGLIIAEVTERHIVTLSCGLLTLVVVFGFCMQDMDLILSTLNLKSFFTVEMWYTGTETIGQPRGINWETIVFIAGMMIMVEGMAYAGFFRWLCMKLAKMVKYRVTPLFITFMILSSVLSMFIDSITVILFLAAVTIEISQLLKFDPVPMILAEVFCANLGGSATMCGDPPNIIIGTSFGYSFMDFMTNTGLMAGVSLIFVVLYFYLVFRKQLKAEASLSEGMTSYPDPKEAITNKFAFGMSCFIFILAVTLLVTHAQTGLTVAFIGVLIAAVTLISAGKNALKLLKKVDYKTLLFFIGLFVVVSGLEETGVLKVLAGGIGKLSGGNMLVILFIILFLSAVCSAFVDNIPFAATMIPVISDISAAQGISLPVMAFTLAMGTDIGGSATPIGASANVVGIATAAREGHIIRWGKYCKIMVPPTVMVTVISFIMIYFRYL